MNVEDAIGKLLHEPGREQAHVTREAHEVDLALAQRGHDFAIVLLARLALRRNHQRVQAALARRLDSWRISPVRDDDRDLRVKLSRSDVVGDGLKVRAAPGKKDAE